MGVLRFLYNPPSSHFHLSRNRLTSGLSPIHNAIMATETQTKQQPAKETFHFVNDPRESINDALTGLTYLKPSLSYNKEYKTVYRNDLSAFAEDHVTTIGFAGGGHEPMFGGFVGDNYLTAYVSGNVFASPTAAQIFEAIKMCQPRSGKPGKGTMVVCGNYTGDILNAGLAITRAQAAGFKVHFCPIGDDVAVGRKKGGKVGRRGLSGHLIGLKNACALAQKARAWNAWLKSWNTLPPMWARLELHSTVLLFQTPLSLISRLYHQPRLSLEWAPTASQVYNRFLQSLHQRTSHHRCSISFST